MAVQDLIIGAASAIFSLLLVPVFLDRDARIPRATSLTTSAVLIVEAFTFLSIGYFFGFATTFVGGLVWLCIAILRGSRSKPGVAEG